jgi:phosphopantetheinyl transferase (holo-ACP synthase)
MIYGIGTDIINIERVEQILIVQLLRCFLVLVRVLH